jgi:hypothetical protein
MNTDLVRTRIGQEGSHKHAHGTPRGTLGGIGLFQNEGRGRYYVIGAECVCTPHP